MILSLRNLVVFVSLVVVLAGCHSDAGKKKDLSFAVNGDFEGETLSWSLRADKKYSRASLYPSDNGNALCLENESLFGRATAVQSVIFDQKQCRPIVIRSWSRVLSCDVGTNLVKVYYSLELDQVVYNDGSKSIVYPYVSFDSNSRDWQFGSQALHFTKPLKSASLLCRWTNIPGRVLFDNVNVGYFPYVDENCSMSSGLVRVPLKNPSPSETYDLRVVVKTSGKGRELIVARSGTLTLPPDGATDIVLSYSIPEDTPSGNVFVDLLDASTSELYFRRKLPWHGKEPVAGSILYQKDSVFIADVSPDSRIYPGNAFTGFRKDVLDVSSARGEFESYQLGISLPQKKQLKFSFGEFRSSSGNILDHNGFEADYVDFVNVKRTTSGYRPDVYPDKLIPSANGIFSLPQGSSAIWLTFHVPRDTAPGIYSGTLEISGDLDIRIPVRIKVFDFSMPERKNIAIVPGISRSDFLREMPDAFRQGKLAAPLYKNFDEHFADYIDLYYYPGLKFSDKKPSFTKKTEMDFDLENLKKHNFNYMRLPLPMFGDAWGTSASWEGAKIPSPEFEQKFSGAMQLFNEALTSSSCRQKYFYRSYDEPKDLKLLEYLCGIVRKALPGTPILATNRLTEKGEFEKLRNCIDIFCPHIIYMCKNLEDNMAQITKDESKKLFIYHNHMLLIDYQRLNARALPWMARRYNAQGILLWCINAWRNLTLPSPNVNAEHTLDYQYTEGVLIYPGKDKPLSSVRWELIREGMEDFEYLHILERVAPEIKDHPALYARAVKLLDRAAAMVSDWQKFSRNYDDYKSLHLEVGTLLDELYSSKILQKRD